jgi:hypothetical protein
MSAIWLFLLSIFSPNEVPLQPILVCKRVHTSLDFPYTMRSYPSCNDSAMIARLVFYNHSDSIASFYEGWNSWGYFNISFEIETKEGSYRVYPMDRDWNKNFPSYHILFPGDSVVYHYDLTRSSCGKGLFTGMIPDGNNVKVVTAYYKLEKDIHESARIGDVISYRYKTRPAKENEYFIRCCTGLQEHLKTKVTDTLPYSIPAAKTFVLSELVSNQYQFKR